MKKAKYNVVVHYEGTISYEVEAESEDEAKRIAETMFGDEDDRTIAAEIADVTACDCWESES